MVQGQGQLRHPCRAGSIGSPRGTLAIHPNRGLSAHAAAVRTGNHTNPANCMVATTVHSKTNHALHLVFGLFICQWLLKRCGRRYSTAVKCNMCEYSGVTSGLLLSATFTPDCTMGCMLGSCRASLTFACGPLSNVSGQQQQQPRCHQQIPHPCKAGI